MLSCKNPSGKIQRVAVEPLSTSASGTKSSPGAPYPCNRITSGPLPPPFQSLLGGSANLRGFRAGTAAGETLAAGSLELRIPLSSPLDIGRFGVNAFVDSGTVYAHDERLGEQSFRTGIGAGVWMTATAFHLGLAVARGRGESTRVHFSAGIAY